jgi:hypothetical protein
MIAISLYVFGIALFLNICLSVYTQPKKAPVVIRRKKDWKDY